MTEQSNPVSSPSHSVSLVSETEIEIEIDVSAPTTPPAAAVPREGGIYSTESDGSASALVWPAYVYDVKSGSTSMKDVGVQVSFTELDAAEQKEWGTSQSSPSRWDVDSGPPVPGSMPGEVGVGRKQRFRAILTAVAGAPSSVIPDLRNWKTLNKQRKIRVSLILGSLLLCLFVLIIGLAAGLTLRNKGPSNLPLPTNHGGPFSGDLTYYEPGLGACGFTNDSTEKICALSHTVYDAASRSSNPNNNPLCGLKIRLRRDEKSVDVTVVDRCVACKPTDIDTTITVFGELADVEEGRVNVEWAWLEDSPVTIP